MVVWVINMSGKTKNLIVKMWISAADWNEVEDEGVLEDLQTALKCAVEDCGMSMREIVLLENN